LLLQLVSRARTNPRSRKIKESGKSPRTKKTQNQSNQTINIKSEKHQEKASPNRFFSMCVC